MEFVAANIQGIVALVSALFGVWALFQRIRLVIREEVKAYGATREDLARVETKVDTLITLMAASPRRK